MVLTLTRRIPGSDILRWKREFAKEESMMSARELAVRHLSPGAYEYVHWSYWYSRRYLPRLLSSPFVRSHPKAHTFPEGKDSALFDRLRKVNVAAPTEMCRVMTRNGSDKGHSRHNYTTIYSEIFSSFRQRPLRIFELGLGTNNPGLISTMGAAGRPGASLRGWRQLFPKAKVFGADIDRDILFQDERIQTFYCDQLDQRAIQNLWNETALREPMDILVEDGLHTFEANVSFLKGSLEKVRPGGYYVVEDILSSAVPNWLELLKTVYAKQFPKYEFALLELPNPANDVDNNLLVIKTPA